MDTYLQEQDAANNPPPKPNDVGKSIGKILGIVIGSLAAIVVIGLFSVYFFKFNPEAKGDGDGSASAPFKAHVKVGKAASANSSSPNEPFKAHVKVGKSGVASKASPAAEAVVPEPPPTEKKEEPASLPAPQEAEAEPQPATPEGQVGNASQLNNSAVVAEELPKPVMAVPTIGEKPVRGRAVAKSTPVVTQASITRSTSPVPEGRKAERSRSPSPEQRSATTIATPEAKKVEEVNVSLLGRQPVRPSNITPSPRPGKRKGSFDTPAGLAPETKETNILGLEPHAST